MLHMHFSVTIFKYHGPMIEKYIALLLNVLDDFKNASQYFCTFLANHTLKDFKNAKKIKLFFLHPEQFFVFLNR